MEVKTVRYSEAALIEKNSILMARCAELQADNQKYAEEVAELKRKNSKTKKQYSALEAYLKEIQPQVMTDKKHIAELQSLTSELKKQVTDLQNQLNASNKKRDSLENEKNALENKKAKLKEENARLWDIINDKTRISRNVSDKNTRLNQELAEYKCQANALSNKLNSIFARNQNPDIVTMYHQLETRLEVLTRNLNAAKRENKELCKKLQELKEADKNNIVTDAETKKCEAHTEKKTKGRPAVISDETRQAVIELHNQNLSIRKIAAEVGISPSSVSNIINRNIAAHIII